MVHDQVHITATMSEIGNVFLYDTTQEINSFDTPGLIPPKNPKPIHTIDHHGIEGYGIDWSLVDIGSLITGDVNGCVLSTKRTPFGFKTDTQFYMGHESSIEDLQWSPQQGNVFASCSADKTIRIWDTRQKKPQLSIKAHDTDVNVISWSRYYIVYSRTVDYLMASGSDDGQVCVWDIRNWVQHKKPETAAMFQWHQKAITSIEWHPTEPSIFACSGADDQLTIWDLALEREEEEDDIFGMVKGKKVQVPAQLLFIHQGQENIKEHHWHPQIPGVLVSTAFDGFSIFKTCNC
jgi:ribosome assembly protein RRB1